MTWKDVILLGCLLRRLLRFYLSLSLFCYYHSATSEDATITSSQVRPIFSKLVYKNLRDCVVYSNWLTGSGPILQEALARHSPPDSQPVSWQETCRLLTSPTSDLSTLCPAKLHPLHSLLRGKHSTNQVSSRIFNYFFSNSLSDLNSAEMFQKEILLIKFLKVNQRP